MRRLENHVKKGDDYHACWWRSSLKQGRILWGKKTRRGQKENRRRETLSFKGKRVYPEIEEGQRKTSLTFLGHVVHAVGHSGAPLFDAESRETGIIVYKVVVCCGETRFNSRL